jgi:hypothetical protein
MRPKLALLQNKQQNEMLSNKSRERREESNSRPRRPAKRKKVKKKWIYTMIALFAWFTSFVALFVVVRCLVDVVVIGTAAVQKVDFFLLQRSLGLVVQKNREKKRKLHICVNVRVCEHLHSFNTLNWVGLQVCRCTIIIKQKDEGRYVHDQPTTTTAPTTGRVAVTSLQFGCCLLL